MTERLVVVLSGVRVDLALVDALAQLRLATKRLGWKIEIVGASDELGALLDFLGFPDLGR